MWKDYTELTKRARFVDATEDPAPLVQSDDYLEERLSGVHGFVRDPMT
jgi:hypothetical protein